MRSGRRAAAAIEFALVAPMLILLGFGMADLAQGFIAGRRLTQAARTVAELASAMAPQPDGSNVLSTDQAWTASTAFFPLLPDAATAPAADYAVTVSSVATRLVDPRCTTGCTYAASIAWSGTFQGSAAPRPCGDLATIPDTSPPAPGSLPQSAFGPTPLLVVDVSYTFHPSFLGSLAPAVRLQRAAYFPPRTGGPAQWIRIEGSGPVMACAVPGP